VTDRIICSRCVEPWEARVIASIKHALKEQKYGAKVTVFIKPDGDVSVEISVKETINRGREVIARP